jgi:hypothetical protein
MCNFFLLFINERKEKMMILLKPIERNHRVLITCFVILTLHGVHRQTVLIYTHIITRLAV